MAASHPKTFKAMAFMEAGGPFTPMELPLTQPGPGEVLIKVIACGVCHSDSVVKDGFVGKDWPVVSGHEVIGDVAAVGEGVTRFKPGERVGGAWHGGHDGTCKSCRRGRYQTCDHVKINGVHFNGGFAEYTTVQDEAVVRVPTTMDPVEAAPLLCAGVSVFNSMRKMNVEQGALVAVQGLGGLGHLAVQFSRAMGYKTVAVSSGAAKRDFAIPLGAHEYIDSSTEDVAARLQEMGGAGMIVCTAPDAEAMKKIQYGLEAGGKLVVLAPIGPVEFDTRMLVLQSCSVHGWASGHALDCEETIEFAQNHGIKCMVEKFPLAEAESALESMLEGKLRFRAVLTV